MNNFPNISLYEHYASYQSTHRSTTITKQTQQLYKVTTKVSPFNVAMNSGLEP
ncbi:hypothetical protein BB560_000001 [Smittium megazygosporum]|uniref:Uncharacterized protein n=1 Tax=Smittium megazygosporum TaxID=133381 RepID=A0A2T9ZLQ2_9FUNG|nr:hypothetical protein BB560_000001 [Smittium megazygosporum]